MEKEEYKAEGLDTCDDAIKMAVKGKQEILEQGFVNISITNKDDFVRISIVPPEGQERVSHDIVCVLDISGSMATEASVKNKDGQKESQGLCYLDILKHATRTIVNNLTEKDRFALISYSDDARLEFELMNMTKENIELAQYAIDNLETEGSTNIWSGIFQAMELLREAKKNDSHQSIYLLTDGEPNIFPPSGYIQQLKKYQRMFPKFYFSLNTFAFGKHIDTPLLDEYAMLGNGQYSFIPCPGFIGTIFVNCLANTLNTMGSQCKLSFELLNGTELINIPGGHIVDGKTIKIGDIKFGQPREVVLQVKFAEEQQQKDQPFMNVKVEYYDYVNKKLRIGEAEGNLRFDQADPMVLIPYVRTLFVDQVKQATKLNKDKKQVEAVQIIKDLSANFQEKIKELQERAQQIDKDPSKLFELSRNQYTQKFIENIKKDVDGEVMMAISQMFSYDHWGKHYLPSLCHCHLKQQCNNFMDPGIQGYGGEMFQKLKDLAEMTFLKLPPPKPRFKKLEIQQPNQQQNQPQNQKKRKNKKKKNQQQQQQQAQQQQYQDKLPVKDSDSEEESNDIYVKKPQQQQQQQQQPQQQKQRSPSPEVDIAQYYNCGGGCFHPSCQIMLNNGQYAPITRISKGTILKNGYKVLAVIKIENSMKTNKMLICNFENGLKVTPNHPVFIENQWQKPKDIIEPKLMDCEHVYNFILDRGHQVNINGIQCATFGHNFKAKAAQHPYFGSNKIINDLKGLKGWQQGLIEISTNQFKRNNTNQQVFGLQNTIQ